MKKLLTIAILILSTFSLKAQVFVNPSLDTTYKAKGIWATSILLADKDVVFKKYATTDTNKVVGFDQYGRLTLRTKSNGGGGVVNNYLNNDSTFFKLNNGNRTAYGRVNFNNTAYEWRGILSHQYIDSGRSPTGKVWSHILQISRGLNSTTTDSLFSSQVKNDATTGFEARYNSTSGPVVSNSFIFNQGLTVSIPSKGINKVLTDIDGNGNAQWVTPSGGGGGTTYTGTTPVVVTGSVISVDTTKAQGKLATFNDVLNSSKWTASGGNIYNNNSVNVGIGTATPAQKLEVIQGANSMKFGNGSNGLMTINGASSSGFQLFQNGVNPFVFYLGAGGPNFSIFGGGNDRFVVYQTGQIDLGGSFGSPNMRVEAAGNVGIGTYLPSAKLDVNGTAQATQFKLSALNTAPASATATGTTGEVRFTATFIYVAIGTNQWVRSPLSTF